MNNIGTRLGPIICTLDRDSDWASWLTGVEIKLRHAKKREVRASSVAAIQRILQKISAFEGMYDALGVTGHHLRRVS